MLTIRYSPDAHNNLDLQEDGYKLSHIGKRMIQEALETGKEILVDNPYLAEACEIMARYMKLEFQLKDNKGEVKDQSGFYRIFAGPLRELDFLRTSVDEFVAGGDDPFGDDD